MGVSGFLVGVAASALMFLPVLRLRAPTTKVIAGGWSLRKPQVEKSRRSSASDWEPSECPRRRAVPEGSDQDIRRNYMAFC